MFDPDNLPDDGYDAVDLSDTMAHAWAVAIANDDRSLALRGAVTAGWF